MCSASSVSKRAARSPSPFSLLEGFSSAFCPPPRGSRPRAKGSDKRQTDEVHPLVGGVQEISDGRSDHAGSAPGGGSPALVFGGDCRLQDPPSGGGDALLRLAEHDLVVQAQPTAGEEARERAALTPIYST